MEGVQHTGKQAMIGPSWAAGLDKATGHRNMRHLIELRWVAVIGQIGTIAAVTLLFGIALPLPQMIGVLVLLIAFNIASHLRWYEQQEVSNRELFFALLVDVATLTAQLYFSGGATNPFVFLYLLQVILSAVLLEAWSTWIIVAVTTACLGGLTLFSKPLALPLDPGRSFPQLYIIGMLMCFALNAILLVALIGRINSNLRTRDAQVANFKQRAVEEEHIVRMGLLASGAAHELGTPLATLSVLVGDWKHLPTLKHNGELQDDIREMETQLQRCKSIVSGVLRASGQTRGESSTRATIGSFLDGVVTEWRALHNPESFTYQNLLKQDFPIAYDTTLKQMIINVLDNALEASRHRMHMMVTRRDDHLLLRVTDDGPGFPADILEKFGTPYLSSKGRAGRGLGLFLVVNVARALGGKALARNPQEGGAEVEVSLPLAAIALNEPLKDTRP